MDNTSSLAICLLASHFLGDFLFSVKIEGTSKRQVLVILKHAAIVGSLTYVLCGAWTSFEIPLLVLISHTLTDLIVKPLGGKSLPGFFWDQIIHLVLSILIAIGVTYQSSVTLYWIEQFSSSYLRILIMAAGAVITVRAGTVLVAAGVEPFLVQIELNKSGENRADISSTVGLKGAGSVIGQLERALIFLFIMLDQPAAIGFLLTAKSILRFGEVKDFQHRRLTEYIIIGTLMSFTYGIFTSYLTKKLTEVISTNPLR
jgi:hypothetical protein